MDLFGIHFQKRGIAGISVLLIFIALIILAVATSAIIIGQANDLSGEATMTYDSVGNQYKAFQIVEVSGTDGRNNELNLLLIDAKLLGDSTPINMEHLSLSIGEPDYRTILSYRGYGAPIENSNEGYNTWAPQELGAVTTGTPTLIDADLDDDGQDDYLYLTSTSIIVDLSGETENLTSPLGVDISAPPVLIDLHWEVTSDDRYATIIIQGTTTTPNTVDEGVTFRIAPYHLGGGYYVTEHLIRARDSINGFILPGDVVRFYAETYRAIETDDIINIRFFYRDMESAGKQVYVGNTFPDQEKVILWPKP